ncbi:MAG TPA: FAD-binding oxidoreductase [Chitinophagales bacterium]|nr:flavodoxin reductase [Chitinophagales bacterium]HMU98460.1 FAD-binding oxidoreductase [Chitinophagales bacterium]HMV03449.1 FAD-binding oxidoreductase [Chitinophagales bacterium]HMY42929.1 FAD-binding oxidoreductase [Chitinophagales bacterium]HMZ94788.1 FAD-binding oxidoreductase [Chitinophagales bacterium]
MSSIIKIQTIEHLTHDVLRIEAEKPTGLTYHSGQAADVAINKPNWEKEWRSFTFTSLPSDNHIEFTIKTYPSHKGVTNELLSLQVGDELIIGDVYGDIAYKGEGIFIAGGSGVTPFLAILRSLEQQKNVGNNKLLFANRKQEDIIHKDEFQTLLGSNFVNILSDENIDGYKHGFITEDIIKSTSDNHTKFYYLCGPPPMMDAVGKSLSALGIHEENIVKESF